MLVDTLKNLRNKKIEFKKQDDNKATYAKKIKKEETRINWNLESDKVVAHFENPKNIY